MTKRMLIDASHAEETRVVVLDGNRVEDYDIETTVKTQLKGNIYLARIVRVEPSLQAAFVEYGGGRHGFLAFGEIHPDYYQIPVADRQRLLAMQAEEAREEEEAEDAAAEKDAGASGTAAPAAAAEEAIEPLDHGPHVPGGESAEPALHLAPTDSEPEPEPEPVEAAKTLDIPVESRNAPEDLVDTSVGDPADDPGPISAIQRGSRRAAHRTAGTGRRHR